ncbi:MAG: amidohydrolase [Gammaproteobacteria bacterium]|nr:amidohydrolase [Gammaproteobacteria bacterium]
MTLGELIDVHTHVVPKKFPANPAPATNQRWPCLCQHSPDRATIEFGGKPFRELDARSWDIDSRIEAMDRDRVSAQVLSPMPELLSYWFPADEGLELARHVNAEIAEMVARSPERFFGFATVPLQEPALAARELSRLKQEGFKGIEIGSNVNGLLLADPCFDEFFAEAERLALALFVHALHPIGAERLAAFPELVPYAAFPLDTGLAAIALIRAGHLERFPTLRIGFSHGGGALSSLVHRLHQGWLMTEHFGGQLPCSPRSYAARFYYDSLVYDAKYLQTLIADFAAGQFFAGSDFPYAIEQKDLHGFVTGAGVTDDLFAGTAKRFLGVL